MFKRKMLSLSFGAVLAVFSFLSSANAVTVSLSDLISSNGTFTSGNLIFSNFSYTATGDMPIASNVTVTDIVDGSGFYGIRFQGAFTDLFGGQGSDALIAFIVTPTQGVLLSDAHLAANTEIVGTPGDEEGFVGVTETFLPDDKNLTLSVYDVEPGGKQLTDFGYFGQLLGSVHVQKDILAISGKLGSTATLSFIDQTFSTTVPEPATVMLMLLGLTGVVMFRRSQRSK